MPCARWLGLLLLLTCNQSDARLRTTLAPIGQWSLAPHIRASVTCDALTNHRDDEDARAERLLHALDVWLRRQPVSSVLSRAQAGALLIELRSDRRFWAQQRQQFARIWVALVDGLSQETRPLAVVLGSGTCERLLSALEQMDEQPAAVNAILRSEVVEKMLGTTSSAFMPTTGRLV